MADNQKKTEETQDDTGKVTKSEAETAGADAAAKVGEKKPEVVDEVAEDLAKEAVKQQAALSTGNESDTITPTSTYNLEGTNLLEPLLGQGLDGLKNTLKDFPQEKAALLLTLERNGQNRTEYVKLLKKAAGIKDIATELPEAGGPDYTNDQTPLSKL